MEKDYLDFDIQIEQAGEGYRVQVLASPVGQASAPFDLPFAAAELDTFLLRAGRPRPVMRSGGTADVEAARAFGGRLFAALFQAQVQDCLQGSLQEAARQGQGLRIRLRLNAAPALADLPWEYLYDTEVDRFLALSTTTPLVRYLELPGLIRPLTVQLPLRILVAFASPSDFPRLDVDAEWERLRAALYTLETQGLVTLTQVNHAKMPALQAQLRQGEYHILHFVGHGGFDGQTQTGILVLEDKQGGSQIVSGRELGVLLHDHQTLRLALLNVCEGGRSGEKTLFHGVAQSLVRQGLPAVIAMQFPVSDQAAITLAQAFYSALADGYTVEAALAEARKQIFTSGDTLEWGTPVLYLRTSSSQLFDLKTSASTQPLLPHPTPVIPPVAAAPPQPTPVSPQRRWGAGRILALVAILLLLGAATWLGRGLLSSDKWPASARPIIALTEAAQVQTQHTPTSAVIAPPGAGNAFSADTSTTANVIAHSATVSATATAIPATPAATSTLAATATANGTATVVAQLATAIAGTLTSQPGPTVIDTPTPLPSQPTETSELTTVVCAYLVDAELATLWSQAEMGCALGTGQITWAAWIPFERGFMIWRRDSNTLYVFYSDGRWQPIPEKWDGTSEPPSRGEPPAGLQAPSRGAGWVWGNNDAVFQSLGWATDQEKGFCAQVQTFEQGFILRSSTVEFCHEEKLFNSARGPGFGLEWALAHHAGYWRR